MAETWRVVLASGEVREVRVEPCVAYGTLTPVEGFCGWRAASSASRPAAMGDSAHEAVARLAVGNGLAVREILAPGEITRAEILAGVEAYAAQLAPMTRVVDVLHAAAVAAGHPAADGDPDAQLCAVRAAAWSAGAEAMRAVAVAMCHRAVSEAADALDRARAHANAVMTATAKARARLARKGAE